jgi:hypothetical protein
MESLISKVLNRCGYGFMEPNEASLIQCLLDFCETGAFGNIDADEAQAMINDGELTIKQICYNLLKVR